MPEALTTEKESCLDLKGIMNNKIQIKMLEKRFGSSEENQAGMIDWIKNNSAKFREDFNNLWEELKNDENYNEAFNLAEKGDDQVLLQVLYDQLNKKFN